MANLAQVVNVLQSVILTEGEKMILTPTYHVFNMYKYHQEATLLESYIENEMKVLKRRIKFLIYMNLFLLIKRAEL